MKLTETQKKFKEQMKEIESQSSPYENSREGNPFHRQKTSIFSFLVLMIVIIATVAKYYGSKTNEFIPTSNFGITPQVEIAQNMNGTQSSIGAIPKRDAESLNQLFTFEQVVNKHWGEVSKYHRTPLKQRNIGAYRQALIDGITSCDKWLIKLDNITEWGNFEQLYLIDRDLLANSSLSFKYYLNYLSSKNTSDVEIGNNYLGLVNKNMEQRKVKFKEILDRNGYRYEIQDDGSMKYWVNDK